MFAQSPLGRFVEWRANALPVALPLLAAIGVLIVPLRSWRLKRKLRALIAAVLRYRAMVCGVGAPGLAARAYFNRYSEDAIDLCDVLSSFSSQNKPSLHELCRVMGLPGKPDGIGGADVERYCREGRIAGSPSSTMAGECGRLQCWRLRRSIITQRGRRAAFKGTRATSAEDLCWHEPDRTLAALTDCTDTLTLDVFKKSALPWLVNVPEAVIVLILDGHLSCLQADEPSRKKQRGCRCPCCDGDLPLFSSMFYVKLARRTPRLGGSRRVFRPPAVQRGRPAHMCDARSGGDELSMTRSVISPRKKAPCRWRIRCGANRALACGSVSRLDQGAVACGWRQSANL